MHTAKPTVIALMGPTACGKTALSIELAKRYNGEIMSVDSALVYRGLDIGTAKPCARELREVPHHLIDVCDPTAPYSAAQFANDAHSLIADIHARGKVPFLVGGTVLYFKVLFEGMAQLPPSDKAIRTELNHEFDTCGAHAMHSRLLQIDPHSAQRLHPNDRQRVLRALEVFMSTGQTLTELHNVENHHNTSFTVHKIGLLPSCRDSHRKRAIERFEHMLTMGFMTEIDALFARGDLHLDLPAIRSIGYRQAWLYKQGEYTFDEMVERSIIATHQLAKRQMTWLNKEPRLTVFDGLQDNTQAVQTMLAPLL